MRRKRGKSKKSVWFTLLVQVLCLMFACGKYVWPESVAVAAELEQTEVTEEKFLVVIDPGHQRIGNLSKEPIGPGSKVKKVKVSPGTKGVSTGTPEYELNLLVSLYLKEELLDRGYEVIMIRETNDVDISNAERAMTANEVQADVFIRIHANSVSDSTVNGVMTICQTPKNPYNGEWYEESRRLSELVMEEVIEETGAKKHRIWETDTMTGINWAMVPTTILEMGFMSNPEEDERMATEEYQRKIARGVADAIDSFLGAGEKRTEGQNPLVEENVPVEENTSVAENPTEPEAYDLLENLGFSLCYIDEANDRLLLLGTDRDMSIGWDDGVFHDNFRGVWGSIDGNLVYMELTSESGEFNFYSVPVLLNGEEYDLQVVYDSGLKQWHILSAWKIADETDRAMEVRRLQPGDEITTIWYMATGSGEDEPEPYTVQTFTVTENTAFSEMPLPDGSYLMMFEMRDDIENGLVSVSLKSSQ